MVAHVREVEEAMGDGTRMELLPEELELREKVCLKAIARRLIAQGDSIDGNCIVFLRSGHAGLSPAELGDLARYSARRAMPVGTVLQWADLQLL